ncbi:hypothetical protein V8G54_018468 [Vigna mungo]|uniref:Uncharacterized protein n=1 Tax=Vigna mungo TaxID=3915 RepID=A0AAQ3N9P1_VIGMU
MKDSKLKPKLKHVKWYRNNLKKMPISHLHCCSNYLELPDLKIGAHWRAHSGIIEVWQLQSPLRMANINFKILSTTRSISCESITPEALVNVCTSRKASFNTGL